MFVLWMMFRMSLQPFDRKPYVFSGWYFLFTDEPVHEISNTVVYATSKASDQPAHTRSLIRAFATRLSIQ